MVLPNQRKSECGIHGNLTLSAGSWAVRETADFANRFANNLMTKGMIN